MVSTLAFSLPTRICCLALPTPLICSLCLSPVDTFQALLPRPHHKGRRLSVLFPLYSRRPAQCQKHNRPSANISCVYSGFKYLWGPFAKVLLSVPQTQTLTPAPKEAPWHTPPQPKGSDQSEGPKRACGTLRMKCHHQFCSITRTHAHTHQKLCIPLGPWLAGQESPPTGFQPSPNLGLSSVISLGVYLCWP